ncbi:hypothetical protein [uncultured Algibacter sp.]|uniref:hypothetical protein n=1 Tax=uncultured Algibacter sp. TaxID=298659 RepID=UPI00260BC4FE|nr:hypothetical protein [uncultured Algibacter sp.]
MTRITHLCFITLLFVFSKGMAKTNAKLDNSYSTYVYSNIQRVRIDFKMPDGFTRHLLLAFTKDNSASDAYDYGYDALNADSFPYDLNWLVDEQRCIIQGVGAFDNTKKYPFWMFMSQSGDIEIALNRLEYFDNPIDVFIYDALLDTYTQINDLNYATNIESGEYRDRFYIAFKGEESESAAKSALSIPETEIENTRISFLQNTNELLIKSSDQSEIKKIDLYTIQGQKLITINGFNKSYLKIPLKNQTTFKNYLIVAVETNLNSTSKKIIISK